MNVALVTGVSSGIGKAVAARLAELGFRTFGTVRGEAEPQPKIELIRLDVRDAESAEACMATVIQRAGRIDVLVNNAGAGLVGAAEETTIDEARGLFETNLFGLMRMTQAVLPAMRAQRSGRIINISSVLGFLPAPFMSIYAATKHAVEGWSESLDHEVRGFGVRVVVVEPAFTRTNIGHGAQPSRSLRVYDAERTRVGLRIRKNIERGVDPALIADVVARAATVRTPPLHMHAGRGARLLRVLRSLAPAAVLDRGIRREFGLETAS
jgi:short-subunit dehydrogenase